MGKSTLAAKLIRCLYSHQVIDQILGDSAKSEVVDVSTGQVAATPPGFLTAQQYIDALSSQLGLPPLPGVPGGIGRIRDKLQGRRVLLVADNLDTVDDEHDLLHMMTDLTSRDLRVLITTRSIGGIDLHDYPVLVVRLQALLDQLTVRKFTEWHVEKHIQEQPALSSVVKSLDRPRRLKWLIQYSGGNPLIIQLLLSDVARSSWEAVRQSPSLHGPALLEYLYQDRWRSLSAMGEAGHAAQAILRFIGREQYEGRRITERRLIGFIADKSLSGVFVDALRELHQRYMFVNHDPVKGNYAITPALTEFLSNVAE